MPKHLHRLRTLPLVVAGCLLLLLLVSMSACAASVDTPAPTQELPTLQAILPFDDPASFLLPKYVSVIPGGYTYVTDEKGAIIVLRGTTLVTVIPLPPGDKPFGYFQGMALQPKTHMGYLANANSDHVYVIQGTEMITTLHDVGNDPLRVGINSVSGLVYIASGGESEQSGPSTYVTVITGTKIVTSLITGLGPNVITADPSSAKVYIGQTLLKKSPYPYAKQHLLAVLDTTSVVTLTSLNYLQAMPPGYFDGDINRIAIDPRSGAIYMIQNQATVIYWYNGQIKRIKLGGMGYNGLHDIAIDPTRGLAYVSSWGRIGSHVVVLKQGEFVTALPVGADPRAVVYDATHDYVYTASRIGHSLAVIRDTQVITTIDARGNAVGMGVDETRGYIYLANPDSHNITIFGFAQEIKQHTFWDFFPFVNK